MGAYYAGQNDSSASTDVPDTGLNSRVKSDMIDSESHPKKFIRAKKSDWSYTDSEWYVPGHKQPIAYSTISTRDSIGAMADDHPDASISELRDLFVYDEESKRVMSAYIDNGYGNQNANEWFSYSENHGLSKNGETTAEEHANPERILKALASSNRVNLDGMEYTITRTSDGFFAEIRRNESKTSTSNLQRTSATRRCVVRWSMLIMMRSETKPLLLWEHQACRWGGLRARQICWQTIGEW